MGFNPLNIMYADYPGNDYDLQFLQQDSWLMDSAVNPLITERKCRWHVAIVLAFIHFPMRLVCRQLQQYNSYEKAALYADLFCRTAQKDERGTLKINWNDWNICIN
jgi:hypothetical protein